MTEQHGLSGMRVAAGGRSAARAALLFAAYVIRRFGIEQGPRVAAALSYTSLLSLVPLATIVMAMIALVPALEPARSAVRALLVDNLLASAGTEAASYFDRFVANAGETTVIGMAFLAIVAIMLLATIEDAFNQMFRVRLQRPLPVRLLVYATILTIGPLAVAASSVLSAQLTRLNWTVGVAAPGAVEQLLLRALSVGLLVLAFTLLYVILPNRRVRLSDAIAGGLVAGLGFAALRWVFGLYVIAFPSYQTIYGALAAVPILMVWMYLSWAVVLLGGVVVASLAVWRAGMLTWSGRSLPVSLLGGVRVLAGLAAARERRQAASVRWLTVDQRMPSGVVEEILARLRAAGIVVRTRAGRWKLDRDPAAIHLHDLFQALGLHASTTIEQAPAPDDPLACRVSDILGALAEDRRRRMAVSLGDLIGAPAHAD